MDPLPDSVKDLANSLSYGSVVGRVQSAVHDELDHTQSGASEIVNQVDENLKELLKTSMERLDGGIQTISTDLTNLVNDIDTKVQQDMPVVAHTVASTTQKAHNRIGELVGQIEDSVIDSTIRVKQPADQILYRAGWNAIGIGAGLLLVLGLLIAVAAVIFARGWPDGIGGIIAAVLLIVFVLAAGALTFVPAVKELALKFVAKDTQTPLIPPTPEIFNVEPNPVIVSSAGFPEIHLHGVHLTPGGQSPVVTITSVEGGTANLVVRGAGDHQITAASPTSVEPRSNESSLEHLVRSSRVTVQLTLTYPDKTTVGCPLEIGRQPDSPMVNPAEIVLNGLSFTPPQPIATQDLVHACVSVTNKGGTPSKPFQIIWLPMSGDRQLTTTIPELPADSQPHEITLSTGYTYPTAGTFQTEVRSNSSEMGLSSAYISGTIDVEAPQLPSREEGAEYFVVTAHAGSGLAFTDAADINFTYTVRDGWIINRSRGDPTHDGINELRVKDNAQSKQTLRAYNYQPEGDTLVRVTGKIWGDNAFGSGAIFERIYKVNIIRTPAIQPPPPPLLEKVSISIKTYQVSEIAPNAIIVKIARHLDQPDESIFADGVAPGGRYDQVSPDRWFDLPLRTYLNTNKGYPKSLFDDYGIGISYDSTKPGYPGTAPGDWWCHIRVYLWFPDGAHHEYVLAATQLPRGRYISEYLPPITYP